MHSSRQIDGQGGQQGEPGHGEKNAGWRGGGVEEAGRGGEGVGGGTERRERGGKQRRSRREGRGIKMGVHANFIILLINFSSSNPPAGT